MPTREKWEIEALTRQERLEQLERAMYEEFKRPERELAELARQNRWKHAGQWAGVLLLLAVPVWLTHELLVVPAVQWTWKEGVPEPTLVRTVFIVGFIAVWAFIVGLYRGAADEREAADERAVRQKLGRE